MRDKFNGEGLFWLLVSVDTGAQWQGRHGLGGGGRRPHRRKQETVRLDLEVGIAFYSLGQSPKVSTSSQKSITRSGQSICSQELRASVTCKPGQSLSSGNSQHIKILPSQLSASPFTLQLEHVILYLVCISHPVILTELTAYAKFTISMVNLQLLLLFQSHLLQYTLTLRYLPYVSFSMMSSLGSMTSCFISKQMAVKGICTEPYY